MAITETIPVFEADEQPLLTDPSNFSQYTDNYHIKLNSVIPSMNILSGQINDVKDEINEQFAVAATANFKGLYNGLISYSQGDVILENGLYFVSLIDSNLGNPTSDQSSWASSAVQGYTKEESNSLSRGFKNIIINGDKRVNQGEYAGGVLADGVYGYDRWKGADSDANIEQIIEQQNIRTSDYTISFDGGGTATVAGVSGLSSGDSISIVVSGNISVKVPKGATNIQLEEGLFKTPFEQRPYGLELLLCQRYLPYMVGGGDYSTHGIGAGASTTKVQVMLNNSPKSRIIPTSVEFAGNLRVIGNGGSFNVTGLTVSPNSSLTNIVLVAEVASGIVANETYSLTNNNDATAYIKIQTEL